MGQWDDAKSSMTVWHPGMQHAGSRSRLELWIVAKDERLEVGGVDVIQTFLRVAVCRV